MRWAYPFCLWVSSIRVWTRLENSVPCKSVLQCFRRNFTSRVVFTFFEYKKCSPRAVFSSWANPGIRGQAPGFGICHPYLSPIYIIYIYWSTNCLERSQRLRRRDRSTNCTSQLMDRSLIFSVLLRSRQFVERSLLLRICIYLLTSLKSPFVTGA